MTGKVNKIPGLYEFLHEAELQHYHNSLKNILQIQNVPQLKYVVEEDLRNIGMSKPECRRLKTFYSKYCPGNYASKLKKFLGRKDDNNEEFLLGRDTLCSRGSIKVPSQSKMINLYGEVICSIYLIYLRAQGRAVLSHGYFPHRLDREKPVRAHVETIA